MITALPAGEEETLTSWLWRVLAEAPERSGEPDILVQLYDAYRSAGVPMQELFKRAVARAVSEWQTSARTYDLLRELVFLAAKIRASGVVLPLCHLLRRKEIWSAKAELEAVETSALAIKALAGFLPTEQREVAQVLTKIYFARGVHPALGDTLFAALCRHEPESYPYFLGRYLALRGEGHEWVDDSLVFGFFVDSVSPETIQEQFPRLTLSERDFLLFWLRQADIQPLGITFDFLDEEVDASQATVRLRGASGRSFDLERAKGGNRLWNLAQMTFQDSFVDRVRQIAALP